MNRRIIAYWAIPIAAVLAIALARYLLRRDHGRGLPAIPGASRDHDKGLPAIAVAAGTSPERARLFANGVDAAAVVQALAPGNCVTALGQKRLVGQIDDAPLDAVLAAIRIGVAGTCVADRPSAPEGKLLDMVTPDVEASQLLAECAVALRLDHVVASARVLPHVAVRMNRVDPREAALAIAAVVGLTLVEREGVWLFLDPGVVLAPELAAKRDGDAWISIARAHLGEVQWLLDHGTTPDRTCAPGEVDAVLSHGQTGLLQAIAATQHGPPCVDAGRDRELATAEVIGMFDVGTTHRGLLRAASGGAFVIDTTRMSPELHILDFPPPIGTKFVGGLPSPRNPFTGPVGDMHLVATFEVDGTWKAIFDGPTGLHTVGTHDNSEDGEVVIDARGVHSKGLEGRPDRAYELERP